MYVIFYFFLNYTFNNTFFYLKFVDTPKENEPKCNKLKPSNVSIYHNIYISVKM